MTYIKASELAVLCQVESRTIANWVADRRLPHHRTPGGHLRFDPIEVRDWLRQCDMPVPDALLCSPNQA